MTTHHVSRHHGVTALLIAAVLATALAIAALPTRASAQSSFTVDVTPTTGLADSDTVSVDVQGIPSGQGIYLMYCIDVGGRASGDQCSEAQVWVSSNPANQAFGAQAPGNSPFDLDVTSAFGDHDCREVTCGIQTRRDHEGSDDESLDTFTPLTFAPEASASPTASASPSSSASPSVSESPSATEDPSPDPSGSPSAQPSPTPSASASHDDGPFTVSVAPTEGLADTDEVTVTISGLPEDQGVYVQLCARPADGGRATGAACDGEGQGDSGLWVLAEYPYPGERPEGIVDPTAGPFALAVHRSFHELDCATVTCGIQTRRDHRAGGDTSLDTFTPVTFAAGTSTVAGGGAAALPEAEEDVLPHTGGGLALAAGTLLAGAALLARRRVGREV